MDDGFDGGGASFSEEVPDDGPCAKICGSLGAMCLGLILFPLSLVLLGWNEQNYVCTDKQIIYSEQNAEELGCNSQGISVDTFGFFSCPIQTSSFQTFKPCMLNKDHQMSCQTGFGTAFSFKSVSASQTVEMYQCIESCTTTKQKKNGQNVNVEECKYSPQWRSTVESTSSFKRQDIAQQGCHGYSPQKTYQFPSNVDPGTSMDYAPPPLLLGDANAAYALKSNLIEQLDPNIPVVLSQVQGIGSITGSAVDGPQPPSTIETDTVALGTGSLANYLVSCPFGLTIGCVRISYQQSSAQTPSVLGKVSPGIPAQVDLQHIPGSWLCSAGELPASYSITEAALDKEGMISYLKGVNSSTVIIIRIIGILLAWAAVFCIFAPCATAADLVGDVANFVPCCGGYIEDFIEGVATTIICILSCSIGCSCALFVIGVVWIAMRPIVGVPLMIGACCICACGVFGYSQLKDNDRKTIRGGQGGSESDPEFGSE